MAGKAKPISFSSLQLHSCSIDEYCEFLSHSRLNGFWWYLLPSSCLGNYSRPFKNKDGCWYFWVKPGFCWPADFTDTDRTMPPARKAILGYQKPACESSCNSSFVFRMIPNLHEYSYQTLDSKRRNIVRRASEDCVISTCTEYDRECFEECLRIWNEHVSRTGWKKELQQEYFHESWIEMIECPGTTVMLARNRASGRCLAWLMGKIIGDLAYIDTIASGEEGRDCRPNDSLIYTYLMNVKEHENVKSVHYGLASSIGSLEKFKESLGFHVCRLPAELHLRWYTRYPLRLFFPKTLKRLRGDV